MRLVRQMVLSNTSVWLLMMARTLILIALPLVACVGCADGPFYAMKRANPYFQWEWQKDRELGPTFRDRLAELDLLQSQLASMTAEKQQQWAGTLKHMIQHDASAEIRARATRTIATIDSPLTDTALNIASADDVEKVRLAACRAWENRQSTAARDMLMSLAAKGDETPSVRQAAIESLAAFDNAEVRATLGQLLDDRSPAVQYQTAQSLQEMTGRNYGGDFESWKQFLAGEDVPEPEPKSMTATLWDSLPSIW